MVLPYPDESLPEHQVSIQDYVDMASRILVDPDTIHNFCHMVLAGRADIDGIEHRLFVNARQGLEEIDTGILTISRDYDSVLSSRIPNKRRRTTAIQFPVGQETGHDVDEARFDQEEDEIGDVTPDDAVSRI
ncbi:hypothetical protein L208DRAFT_1377198 [Tricholoma matsutake]|nr:hypothetical protein L208DRAFT_1377198 [Tricholoma matsutake 945]